MMMGDPGLGSPDSPEDYQQLPPSDVLGKDSAGDLPEEMQLSVNPVTQKLTVREAAEILVEFTDQYNVVNLDFDRYSD